MPLIKLIRPHHYVKNLFLFLPLFFVGKIDELELLGLSTAAFVAFCLGASAVYVLNDIVDIRYDQKHPSKKLRPLAAGVVSVKAAWILSVVLTVMALVLMAFVSRDALSVLIIYILMNIAYSFGLKKIALIDVTIVSVGFVLRLLVGAAATQVTLSSWIVIMTFLLALFMALAKRRDDVLMFQKTGEKMRSAVDGYSLPFIDTAIAVMSSVVIVAYINYVMSSELSRVMDGSYLYLTAFFVVLGIMRYLQKVYVYHDSSSPTKIAIKDRIMQLILLGWVTTFAWAIY